MPTHGPTSEGRLTAVLDRFEEVWRTGDAPPTLGEFLMVGDDSAETRRQLLIELIKIDLEYRWQQPDHGVATAADAPFPRRARLEDYVQQYPELGPIADLPLDLICEEFRVRQQWGDRPQTAEYLERFPGQQASLDRRLPRLQAELLAVQGRRRLQELPRSERFIIQQRLGSGGMGVVYLAFDCERKQQVALKTMQEVDPAALYRFKQEFRALADVAHPHLVSLYELFAEGDQWFFSMELVEGVPFLDYVRGRSPQHDPSESPTDPNRSLSRSTFRDSIPAPDASAALHSTPPIRALSAEEESRLRSAMRQLAEALAFVHQAGVLHRDVKPSNVLVTPAGQLKLLDFGLAVTTEPDALLSQATRPQFAGTAAYMSPEQAASQPLTPASDWYSLGVMLYEALTGQLPFTGSSLDILLAKRTSTPVPPEQLLPGLPKDLCALCTQLLAPEPTARPSGEDVLKKLACDPQKITVTSADSASPQLVGRESHLQSLQDSLQSLLAGETVLVQVSGHSGAGKSALVQRFLEDTHDRHRAVILTGRCYEQESVPFKALDDLIDSLSRYLNRLGDTEVAVLLPRDVVPLLRLFPVLQRVKIFADAPRPAVEIPDPQELRQRAFGALRELLARLGDRRTLVLFIDDVQWGDIDSAHLLANLLKPPNPPQLLLIAAYRSEDITGSPFLQYFEGGVNLQGVSRRLLPVDALGWGETCALARRLMASATVTEEQMHTIARESGGNPFFLQELVEYLGNTATAEPASTSLELDTVLWRRIEQLAPPARALLEVIAVSGRPLQEDPAWQAAQVAPDARLFNDLRHQRLVRTVQSGEDLTWDTYHDRVRETILGRLADQHRTECHARLAHALEATGAAEPDVLARHYLGGGKRDEACRYFAHAAKQAAEALAFEQAANLYRRALESQGFHGDRYQLLRCLGDALANSGRGQDAAQAYIHASKGASSDNQLVLRRQAAEQYLQSGHLDAGMAMLRDVLKEVDLPLSTTSRGTIFSLVATRARLKLRGLRIHEIDASHIRVEDLRRLDTGWSAGLSLSMTDTISAFGILSRHFLLALKVGEPARIARSLAAEIAYSAMAGSRNTKQTTEIALRASALATKLKDPYIISFVILMRSAAAWLTGNFVECRQLAEQAESKFRTFDRGVAWELVTSYSFASWSLWACGRILECEKKVLPLQAEARVRGNLYALANVSVFGPTYAALARDEPERARHQLDEALGGWTRAGFHVQHANALSDHINIDLYEGAWIDAWEHATESARRHVNSGFQRIQTMRIWSLYNRARCALAAVTHGHKRDNLLDQVRRDIRSLRRERAEWANALSLLIEAGLGHCRGDVRSSHDALMCAVEKFDSLGMELHAAAARRLLGQLIQGDEGHEILEVGSRWMSSQSIVNLDRMTGMLVPGFPRC